MDTLIRELVGRKVTIYTSSGSSDASDVGTIEKADQQWVKLRKNDKELLFINVERIRIIKPFEAF